LRFRIGIHLGDVMIDGDDLLGEGVNLAARLQSMADPGGILISQQVYDQVQKKLAVGFQYLGEKRPKARLAPERTPREARSRSRFLGLVARLGAVLAVLFVIDLMTGGAWWVQWPALGIGIFLVFRSPLFDRSG
jgi:class 3 adenylate cyclase